MGYAASTFNGSVGSSCNQNKLRVEGKAGKGQLHLPEAEKSKKEVVAYLLLQSVLLLFDRIGTVVTIAGYYFFGRQWTIF